MLYGAACSPAGAHPVSPWNHGADGPDGSVAVLVVSTYRPGPYDGHALRDRPIAAIGMLGHRRARVGVRGTDTRYTPMTGPPGRAGPPAWPALAVQRAEEAPSWTRWPGRPRPLEAPAAAAPPWHDGAIAEAAVMTQAETLPRRLPVLDGDAHHDRHWHGGELTLWPLPASPGPPGDRGAVRAAAGPGPGDRAVPRRRLRQQVRHQDGAPDRGHRAQGRAPGADPERRSTSR